MDDKGAGRGRGLPLAGLLVVSVEQAVAAPYATRQLADLGARVIKVERPGPGDFARGYDKTVHGQSSYFVWLNRGKESVVLDVKDPADRALLTALTDRADVFVQNLVPGAAARLGLDAAALRARRPALIHCSISGYGEDGPYAAKKAYDLLIQCEAGLVLSTGTPEAPAKAGFSVADLATGVYAYSAILAALYDRERTGAGATLRVCLLDALGELMSQPAYFSHYGGEPPRRTGARHPSISPYGPFRAADGSVFFGIQNEREWLVLCRDVLRRADVATDPRFATNTGRVAHHDELTALIESAFAERSADEVSEALEAAGIANARLRAPADLFSHPQLAARHRWRPVATPGGEIAALLPPAEIAGTEPAMGKVPALGEHTAAVRAEFGASRPPGADGARGQSRVSPPPLCPCYDPYIELFPFSSEAFSSPLGYVIVTVGRLGRTRVQQMLDERPTFDPRLSRHRHRKQRRRPSRRAMAAMGVGAALLGAGIAAGANGLPRSLADSYGGQAPLAATLTRAPTVSQAGASAFGYSVASVPAGLATRTPASSPTPRHSATATAAPSMTQAAAAQAPASQPGSASTLTPQPTAQNETPAGQNQKAWSEAILTALGDPLTSANIVSIGYWMQNEAGSPPSGIVGANNPINVSEPGYGGTQIQYEAPGYYLMSYPTVADGVAATAAYLNNGSYPQILSDLKQGIGLSDPNLGGELQEYSGSGYSTIPDAWGQSQGMPES